MEKIVVKDGRRIIGFAWRDRNGDSWFAFGRPSQREYIAYACSNVLDGAHKVEEYSKISI